MLQKNKETISDNICFSDYMYRINSKEQREYRIIFVTGNKSLNPCECIFNRRVTLLLAPQKISSCHKKDSTSKNIQNYNQ